MAGIVIGARWMVDRAEPILRKRVTETLSARFKSRIELAELHVWFDGGMHAEGKGLRIYGASDPNPWAPGVQPLLAVDEFHFQTALRNLFLQPMRADTVFVKGFTMNVPPKKDRREMSNMRRHGGKMSVAVKEFVFADARILINTVNPDKAPLEFAINDLRLVDTGRGRPLRFDANLINPRPVGQIHSVGLFGPLDEQSPGDTPVLGDYQFTNADLGTIRGLGGILNSEGHYWGTLDEIQVDGKTDTPDFRIAISGHRVPLHTEFHAIVDGTDGDTYLQPVKATVRDSSFTATGKVIRRKDVHGREIDLTVVLDKARIEDLLILGVKTDPPVMSGAVGMTCHLNLLPGERDIADRLRLRGNFTIRDGIFENAKVQRRIDDLSLRSRGHLKELGLPSEEPVRSEMRGHFKLDDGLLSFSLLHFEVPGTDADMTGEYSLDGRVFDFHGKLKMQAKLSQMTKGWKSLLLKPIDPFFHKDGAGTELPFKVTGTRAEPHFGLDFHHDKAPKKPNELSSVE